MYVSSIHSMIVRHYLSRCVCLLQVGSSVETDGWIELISNVGVSFDLSYVLDISGYLQKYRYVRLDGVRKVSLCTPIVVGLLRPSTVASVLFVYSAIGMTRDASHELCAWIPHRTGHFWESYLDIHRLTPEMELGHIL